MRNKLAASDVFTANGDGFGATPPGTAPAVVVW